MTPPASMRPGRIGARRTIALASLCALVALASPAVAADEQEPLTIRFGVASDIFFDVDAKDAQAALDVWVRQIGTDLKRPLRTSGHVLSDAEALTAAIGREALEVVGLPSLEYLRLRDRLPIVPALVGSPRSGPQDEHVLLVRRDAGISEVKALVGKGLIVQSGSVGVMAQAWLDILLARHGAPPATRFFGSIKQASKASQAVLPLFFRQVHAAVVTQTSYATLVELNPQLGREIVSLAHSPKLLMTVMCFHRKADEEVRRVVIQSALALEHSAAGRQVLLLFKIARVIPFEPAYLEGVATLFRDHRALYGGSRRG